MQSLEEYPYLPSFVIFHGNSLVILSTGLKHNDGFVESDFCSVEMDEFDSFCSSFVSNCTDWKYFSISTPALLRVHVFLKKSTRGRGRKEEELAPKNWHPFYWCDWQSFLCSPLFIFIQNNATINMTFKQTSTIKINPNSFHHRLHYSLLIFFVLRFHQHSLNPPVWRVADNADLYLKKEE